MDEEKFNMSLRKFLKEVGVTSQREIEAFVRKGGADGPALNVKMVLSAEGTDFTHTVDGKISTQ
jgi:16S rRNA U516 pseudouridylate synthase RsuA-like enzyme